MKKWRCIVCGYIHEGDEPPEECPICGVGPEEFELVEEEEEVTLDSPEVQKVIILGNGAAGMEAARTLRELRPTVQIQVFSDEPFRFYSRIHLSQFIGGDFPEERLYVHPMEWLEEHRILFYPENPVIRVFPEDHRVRDAAGAEHTYDRLIIATGARAFIPPLPGVEKTGVFALRNLSDARRIREYLKHCHTAVVIGGGILGVEVAFSLNQAGLEVTVLERGEYPMHRQLDEVGGNLFRQLLERQGIRFRTHLTVERVVGDGTVRGVETTAGEVISTDMVVFSTGIRSHTELATRAGLEVSRGIVVDDHLRTSHPHIFAAGDVAEFHGTVYGIWPAAVEQGAMAARNALGKETIYTGTLPIHVLKVAGMDLTSLGEKDATKPGQHTTVYLNQQEGQYLKLIHDGVYLQGAITLGIPGVGFRLEKLLKKRVPIRGLIPEIKAGNWKAIKQYRGSNVK